MAVRHDLRSESPEYLPWRELNARLGLCTMAAIPLQIGDECYGALSIYSSQPDVFALEEVCLLREMTVQLGIGIQSLRVSRARKAAERQLNLFAGAIASTSDGVMITDAVAPAHPIVYVNPAFTRITGYSAEEALGKSGRFLLAENLPSRQSKTFAMPCATAPPGMRYCAATGAMATCSGMSFMYHLFTMTPAR